MDELNKLLDAYNFYISLEWGENIEKKDLLTTINDMHGELGLAYTTWDDNPCHDIQVSYDVGEERLNIYLESDLKYSEKWEMSEFTCYLECADWNDVYGDALDRLYRKGIDLYK